MDNDALREERYRLLDENAQMRVNGPKDGADSGNATIRYLRSKVSSLSIHAAFSLILY